MKVLEKSRRIGGTYSTSYGQFRELMDRKGHDIIVVTRDENLATEFVGDVTRWAHMWNAIQPRSMEIPNKGLKRLSLEIPHASGTSRLLAVSSNPNAAIGKGGSLVLDEFAAHKDADLLMALAQPIIMAGGSMSVLSTHRSRNSRFNEIVLDSHKPDTQWSRHRTTIYDAVEQGLVEEIVNPNMIKLGNEPWKTRQDFLDWLIKSYDAYTFQQEFCCVPSDDASSLLTIDEVNGAKLHMESLGHLKEGAFYLGYDCAESIFGDFATRFVIRADNNNQVDLVDKKYFERGTPINEQIDDVVDTARKYSVRKVVSDNAGIGRHPTTILSEKLGEHMVVPFDPTLQSKGEMCTKVKRYFQNGWVRMEDDKRVEEDFLSIDRLITPSNNVVYHANRTGAIGHGDGFSAFAMALTEVPEKSRGEIKGVASKKADPYDVVTGRDDIEEMNRREDEAAGRNQRATY
ncbi:MAG: terminase large subunit domain-containing protein [Planctomycetota bacterium]